MSLEVINLTKTYENQRAVDNISFSVDKGDILGFLGPNGAGKSTTMKVATGYIPASSGKVIVASHNVATHSLQARAAIGYLPEHNPLYLDMYVHEFLTFIGKLRKLSSDRLKSNIRKVIAECGLEREQNKKIGSLSKGYRQRVGLAQALVHDPKVLILDEPTTGLDPNQIVEIRQLIKSVALDKTVVFSTHIMQEVQALCNKVVIINQGKLVANTTLEQLKRKTGSQQLLVLTFQSPIDDAVLKTIEGVINVKAINVLEYHLTINPSIDVRQSIINLSAQHSWKLSSLHKQENSLEEIFKNLTVNSHT